MIEILTIKERRFALEYVRNPEATPTQLMEIITGSKSQGAKGREYLKKPEVMKYIEDLQNNVAKQLNLTQLKQIKKLQKIYKKAMKMVIDAQGNQKPTNLNAATQALSTINAMTGLDKPRKQKIEIDTDSIDFNDAQYAEKVLMGIMKEYMNRNIDKEDLDSLMKSLDTLATYKLGTKIEGELLTKTQKPTSRILQ